MLFVIIQLSMTSFACRDSLKMATYPIQQKRYQFDEKPINQTNYRSGIAGNRNSNTLPSSLTRIEVPVGSLMDFIDIYEWRNSTDYPIVSCNWKRVIFNKAPSFIANNANKGELATQVISRNASQIASLWVQNESIVSLEQFQLLSIAQFLYAFKETLVGFERLFALFGSFEISPGMVGVNSEGNVKVWVSRHYHINAKIDINQKKLLGSEQQFMVNNIKEIFLRCACDSSNFRDFFKGIESLKTFIECLKFIEDFSISKRIIVSRKILKKHNPFQKRPLSPIINLKPIARTPKFIAQIHQKKSQLQQSIPSLDFHQYIQTTKDYYCSQLKTKETLNQADFFDSSQDSLSKVGKIVKNKGRNLLLSQARSLKNLHETQIKPNVESTIEKNTLQQQMRRLLQDDPESEAETEKQSLMELGRKVRESFTILE